MNLNFSLLLFVATSVLSCCVLAIDDEFEDNWNEFEESQRVKELDENDEVSSEIRFVTSLNIKWEQNILSSWQCNYNEQLEIVHFC